MKIVQNNGRLWINDKEVKKIIYMNNTSDKFPINSNRNNSSFIEGNGNVIIQNSSNINTGNITHGGNFHLGDK